MTFSGTQTTRILLIGVIFDYCETSKQKPVENTAE